jgi:4-diphosphocytidyl-2C-methyl-D-erythritol kinase
MTTEREEILISQVGEINGKLDRMLAEWDYEKKMFATHEEVSSVSARLTRHENGHVSRKTLTATWVGSAIMFVTGAGSMFFSLFKK